MNYLVYVLLKVVLFTASVAIGILLSHVVEACAGKLIKTDLLNNAIKSQKFVKYWNQTFSFLQHLFLVSGFLVGLYILF